MADTEMTDTREAAEALAKRLLDLMEAQCEAEMSRADHQKKHAMMDNHTSEICHQEGRWHCANDLLTWVSATRSTLAGAPHER